MGFTRWPADNTGTAKTLADLRIATQGDLAVVNLAGGVPWPEALSGASFSVQLDAELGYKPPAGHRTVVLASPLRGTRDGLAPYWGTSASMALPYEWQARSLLDLEVKTAYLNFLIRVIDRMQPAGVAFGVEVNALLTKSPAQWEAYKSFHRYVYTELKRRYQGLPVFVTIDILHLNGWVPGAQRDAQYREVGALMGASDIFVMASYPYLAYAVPQSIDNDFFGFARGFGKPIAVAATTYTSQNVTVFGVPYYGSEALQQDYLEKLLGQAHRDRYEFVCWFAATDSEALAAKLPGAAGESAKAWMFSGLYNSSSTPKPALSVWQRYRGRSYVR